MFVSCRNWEKVKEHYRKTIKENKEENQMPPGLGYEDKQEEKDSRLFKCQGCKKYHQGERKQKFCKKCKVKKENSGQA